MKLGIVLTCRLPRLVLVLAFAEKDCKFALDRPVSPGRSAVVIGGAALGLNLVRSQAGLAEQAVTHRVRKPANMA